MFRSDEDICPNSETYCRITVGYLVTVASYTTMYGDLLIWPLHQLRLALSPVPQLRHRSNTENATQPSFAGRNLGSAARSLCAIV